MSLINQMLKDLESRRTPDPESQGLLHEYATQRTGGFDRKILLLLSLLVALLAMILAYLLWDRFSSPAEHTKVVPQAIAAAPSRTASTAPAPAHTPEKPAAKPAPVSAPPAAAPAAPSQPARSPARLISIQPAELTGNTQPQRLILVGENLPRDARVRVNWRGGNKLLPPQRITWRDSKHLAITLTTGTDADTWSVALQGVAGAPLQFRVVPPPPVAVVDSTDEPPVTEADSTIEKHVRPLRPEQLAEQHYQRGYQLLQNGDQNGAEKQWREALGADPAHIASREGLAGLYISHGRNVEAGDILAKGLKYHPGYGPFALLYARLQVQNGLLDRAVQVLENAMEAKAQNADFLAFLAALYQRQKAFDKSIATYKKALSLQPQQGVWWMGIGISLEGAGKTKEAISAYNEAKKSNTLTAKLRHYVEGRLQTLQ